MKYLIEVDIPKDHVLLHRLHVDIKDVLGGSLEMQLGEGAKVKVKKLASEKKGKK